MYMEYRTGAEEKLFVFWGRFRMVLQTEPYLGKQFYPEFLLTILTTSISIIGTANCLVRAISDESRPASFSRLK